MDYFNDVLATFLSLDRGNILAVYGRNRELSDLINNIWIGVPKMNEALKGLEQHKGEQLMTEFSFLGELYHLIIVIDKILENIWTFFLSI